MNTLALTVDVEYVHVKARAEAPPHYLAVYLDRSWTGGRSVPVKAAHWHDDRPLTMRATVEGRWARHAQIPRDAQLCFQATTTTMNRNDVPCQQECGALNLPLAELLAQHAAQPGSWTKETLRVHTSRHHLAKGTVRVRVHSVALTGADALTFGPATPTANLAANVDGILGIFNRYLADYEREDKQFQIVFPGSARINCPLTPSEQTVANTQVCVPFAGYMRYEVPATEPGWWAAQMLVRDARLHGGTGSLARYGRYVAAQPAPQRANEWLQVCAQYTQQLPYVGDRTAGEPVEMVRMSPTYLSFTPWNVTHCSSSLRQRGISAATARTSAAPSTRTRTRWSKLPLRYDPTPTSCYARVLRVTRVFYCAIEDPYTFYTVYLICERPLRIVKDCTTPSRPGGLRLDHLAPLHQRLPLCVRLPDGTHSQIGSHAVGIPPRYGGWWVVSPPMGASNHVYVALPPRMPFEVLIPAY